MDVGHKPNHANLCVISILLFHFIISALLFLSMRTHAYLCTRSTGPKARRLKPLPRAPNLIRPKNFFNKAQFF
jgi:hypothetical protein